MKEQDQQGINGSHNGIEADHLGLLPDTPRVTKSYQERDKTARSSSAVSAACGECVNGWIVHDNNCLSRCSCAGGL